MIIHSGISSIVFQVLRDSLVIIIEQIIFVVYNHVHHVPIT